ncbi:hypothetical protein ACI3EY_16570 [Ornithinimicrobium sp. LYQ92]|uniref:hypothetical protein n=1 Tax=Serinicoccus sp. LYQ92 TaxID=3378798 RepID=UPI003854842F
MYTETPVTEVTWDHSIALGSGQIMGMDGSVTWADPAQPSPLDGTWTREAGHYVEVDWAEEGRGTTRLVTGRVDESSGGTDQVQARSTLTDWTSRLESTLPLRPVGYWMPANPLLSGGVRRKPGLFSWWFTHQALTRAGFYPSQAVMTSSVLYVSMCGSAWPVPDLKHAYSPLGEARQIHRVGANDQSPVPVQGDDCPCTANVYGLYLTRTATSSQPWQLTADLGTRSPSAGDTGRVRMRVHPSGTSNGIGLDWTQTHVRVYRWNDGGTMTQLGSYARLRGGQQRMRWSLIARSDGTARLLCEDDTSGNRTFDQVATFASTSVPMPTGSTRCSVIVESEGIIGAVQVSRGESTAHVARIVGAKIIRDDSMFNVSTRSLGAWDYVEPTQAGAILTKQADAERGLRGMPLCQWIDENGKFVQADFASLAAGALNPSGDPVEHWVGPDQNTKLHNFRWAVPGKGPWRSQVVTYVGMRRLGDGATIPTYLLGQGRQETVERGTQFETIIHPSEDEIWLEPELRPYLAGNPYPSETYPHPAGLSKWLDRGIGTIVGGSRRDEDGNPTGWIVPGDVPEWSLTSTGHITGALRMVDPRTVVVSGTAATPSGLDMSTMPSEASPTLPEPRKQQPLPQFRGYSKAVREDRTVSVSVTGDERHPDAVHDAGMWVQGDNYAAYIASELAEALTDPVEIVQVDCSLDPWIKVGQVIEAHQRKVDGSVTQVRGVVVGARGSTSSASMSLDVAVTAKAVQEPEDPPEDMSPPVNAPPRTIDPPPGYEPIPYEPS